MEETLYLQVLNSALRLPFEYDVIENSIQKLEYLILDKLKGCCVGEARFWLPRAASVSQP
jgi:hypothetical protein